MLSLLAGELEDIHGVPAAEPEVLENLMLTQFLVRTLQVL
jgi:hypothetical protein|tara:strand:+ start:174 stop:293 length:120 start_codon:yes stop_codon:yes gene_type:complete